MFRIDGSTASASLPTPAAPGTPGYFTAGSPGAGTPATIVTADFLNMLQEELVSLLTAASISPSKTTFNQVLTAVRSVATAQFTQSIAANGWQKLPSGTILQWGVTPASSASAHVAFTFPIAFPAAVYSCVLTAGTSNSAYLPTLGSIGSTGGSFSVWSSAARIASQASYFIAIGS